MAGRFIRASNGRVFWQGDTGMREISSYEYNKLGRPKASYSYEADLFASPNRDAAAAVIGVFKQYGLESLAPRIIGYMQQGYSSDTIALMLQDTTEYKQRFAANEARKKAGLPVLSPQEYIATERSYRQIMQQHGLPVGFYDQNSDFTRFLSDDISPQEVQQRVQTAAEFVQRADPRELAAMRRFYTTGDLVAYALDPKRAAPLVGKSIAAATIAGQADSQGIGLTRAQAERLAASGVTRDAAQQGFAAIASEQPNANKLASIYGEGGFSTQDLIDETFNANASIAERRRRLASKERGAFSGSSAVNQGSLARNSGGL